MGNAIGAKKKSTKVMKIDGTTFKVKPLVLVMKLLRDHPGHDLLESEDVKRHGVRARPLNPTAQLKPGKLYFLVELPRRRQRRAWSGNLQVSAKERLESLKIFRRSMSDMSLANKASAATGHVEETMDGGVRMRVRLPKVQVEKLMQESKDAAEAAEKIMKLCTEKDGGASKAIHLTLSSVKSAQQKESTPLTKWRTITDSTWPRVHSLVTLHFVFIEARKVCSRARRDHWMITLLRDRISF